MKSKEKARFNLDDCFRLTNWFSRTYCRNKEEGMNCPFLISGKCINFSKYAVTRQKEIRNTEVVFGQKGCDYALVKLLLFNKGFFIGKLINYSNGSNLSDKKIIEDINYNREKNFLSISIRGEEEIAGELNPLFFIVYFQTDYLHIKQVNNFVLFNDALCKTNSFIVQMD